MVAIPVSFRIAGRVPIGGVHPIPVQTMCNTSTDDIEASVEQCRAMAASGADLIRLTTQGLRQVESLRQIKERLRAEGIGTPLVADIHFLADAALAAASVADKVRINPGNFAKEHEVACAKFRELLALCRQHGTAIRIGLNHGSLGERITHRYGNTPLAMKEAVMEWLRMCIEEDFHEVVVSLKASNTLVMVEAYRLLYAAMRDELGMVFPLHLGVTEAGEGEDGRLKSAVGIGALLIDGIGDTIRVSLSEEPECEIPVARKLVDLIPECARLRAEAEQSIKDDTITLQLDAPDWETFQLKAAMAVGALLIDRKATKLVIRRCEGTDVQGCGALADAILQAARIKFTKTEYISCPGCGRTLYNLQETIARIKAATNHLVGLKIGIMGCIVNGPGEMADADYGYVGAGRGKISLYRGKECIEKNIPETEAVDRLLAFIEQDRQQS
mgnify:CR=1 FL=1